MAEGELHEHVGFLEIEKWNGLLAQDPDETLPEGLRAEELLQIVGDYTVQAVRQLTQTPRKLTERERMAIVTFSKQGGLLDYFSDNKFLHRPLREAAGNIRQTLQDLVTRF